MKRILLSFVALLSATLVFAQPAITISGNVTDNAGTPLAQVEVIVVDSTPSQIQFAIAFTDAQGFYSVQMQTTAGPNVIAGVTDCNGNTVVQQVQFNGMLGGTANFAIACAGPPTGGGGTGGGGRGWNNGTETAQNGTANTGGGGGAGGSGGSGIIILRYLT